MKNFAATPPVSATSQIGGEAAKSIFIARKSIAFPQIERQSRKIKKVNFRRLQRQEMREHRTTAS